MLLYRMQPRQQKGHLSLSNPMLILGKFHEKNMEVQKMTDIFCIIVFFAIFVIFRGEREYDTIFVNYWIFC